VQIIKILSINNDYKDPRDEIRGLTYNKGRGGGYIFGADVTEHFLNNNNLELIIRSHEVQMKGLHTILKSIFRFSFTDSVFQASNGFTEVRY
jgi:hypothetical protein